VSDADVRRLRNEFLALPGLALSMAQTARLLSIRIPHAAAVLDALVRDGFLVHTGNGLYRRVSPLPSFISPASQEVR
jgi:hypothetical protein